MVFGIQFNGSDQLNFDGSESIRRTTVMVLKEPLNFGRYAS